jgi:hypothetical protein
MSAKDITPRPLGGLWLALFGPLLWAAHLFALYALEALVCAGRMSNASHLRPLAVVLTAITVAVLLALIAAHVRTTSHGPRSFARFLGDISTVLAVFALIGVLWGALSAVLLPACAPAIGP